MSQLHLYKDTSEEYTMVSNSFIDVYMKEANEAQIKIYLYLIRMLSSNQGTSISEIADKFNYMEKDVLRALSYWENMHLLNLEFDKETLVGIQFGKKSPPSLPTKQSVTQADLQEVRSEQKRPEFTLDQIKELQSKEEVSQLLFIVESYMKRTLTSTDIQSVFFLYDTLGFSIDLIDHLFQYCIGNDKKSLHYIEKIAMTWAEENITSPRQAAAYHKKYTKTVYSVMKALGKSGDPSPKEKEYIDFWSKDLGFSLDIILEACNRTTLQTDKNRFPYANQILNSWKSANVHHLEDIKNLDSQYKKEKPITSATPAFRAVTTNKFNDFAQNTYDFDELEKELLHQ